MPTSSPVCSGYVEYESKKGKWNKRWLELREHSLWLSKRDTVRLLCQHRRYILTLLFRGKTRPLFARCLTLTPTR